MAEEIIDLRGTKRSEIIGYFSGMDGIHTRAGKFVYRDWEVEVGEEGVHTVGSLRFPSVKVTFRGEKELLEKEIYAFRIRFWTAGA
ncbi:MAG: hypothetical protein ACOYU3_00700 [Bacillota bacterium]